MHVHLTNSTVDIDGQPLGHSLDEAAMTALAGAAVRSRDIPMHPSGARRAHVSASGIVWYVDYPEDRISHLFFALAPEDVPEFPAAAFTGSIRLNGALLTSETSEAKFPRHGEVEVHGHHHSWSYETSTHHIAFGFKRQRNRLGKRSGVHRLAFVEIDFGRGSEQDGVANGRQPFRSEASRTSAAAASRR